MFSLGADDHETIEGMQHVSFRNHRTLSVEKEIIEGAPPAPQFTVKSTILTILHLSRILSHCLLPRHHPAIQSPIRLNLQLEISVFSPLLRKVQFQAALLLLLLVLYCS